MENIFGSISKKLINQENEKKEVLIGVWWSKSEKNPYLISYEDHHRHHINMDETLSIRNFMTYLQDRLSVEKDALENFNTKDQEIQKALKQFEEEAIAAIQQFKETIYTQFCSCRKTLTLTTDFIKNYSSGAIKTDEELKIATTKYVKGVLDVSLVDLKELKENNNLALDISTKLNSINKFCDDIKSSQKERLDAIIHNSDSHSYSNKMISAANAIKIFEQKNELKAEAKKNYENPAQSSLQSIEKSANKPDVTNSNEKQNPPPTSETGLSKTEPQTLGKSSSPDKNIIQTPPESSPTKPEAPSLTKSDSNIDQNKNVGLQKKLFEQSSIVKPEEESLISDWITQQLGTPKSFEIIFNTKNHGFGGVEFHKRCNQKGPTIVFIESSSGKRFGGYANSSWDCKDSWIKDEKCFIFSLDLKEKYLHKPGDSNSMYGFTNHGPRFGKGSDISLFDNCNTNTSSRVTPYTYDTKGRTGLEIAGGQNFGVKNYEVWKVK